MYIVWKNIEDRRIILFLKKLCFYRKIILYIYKYEKLVSLEENILFFKVLF